MNIPLFKSISKLRFRHFSLYTPVHQAVCFSSGVSDGWSMCDLAATPGCFRFRACSRNVARASTRSLPRTYEGRSAPTLAPGLSRYRSNKFRVFDQPSALGTALIFFNRGKTEMPVSQLNSSALSFVISGSHVSTRSLHRASGSDAEVLSVHTQRTEGPR
jgi:hypothetical protein